MDGTWCRINKITTNNFSHQFIDQCYTLWELTKIPAHEFCKNKNYENDQLSFFTTSTVM